MPSSIDALMTRDELLHLFHQLGSWLAVRKQLNLSPQQLITLRKRLNCYNPQPHMGHSVLEPYLDQIRALAAQGLTCPKIVALLALPVQAEQLRRQMHKHGIALLTKRGAQPGEKHRDWKGGRLISGSGYVLLYMPDHPQAKGRGYVWEHRYVMEQHLGRYLEPSEVVHHINGDKQDNRIENLQLYASNAEHLAGTLKGRVPQWTEDGKRRISQAVSESNRRRGKAYASGE